MSLLRASLGLVLFGLSSVTACVTRANDDPPAGSYEQVSQSTWNVNDVSILFPYPEAAGDARFLTPMKDGDKELLPRSVFEMLGRPGAGIPFLIETAGRDKLYPLLRVTSMRVDPCFDVHQPSAAPKCVRQVRLVAQPVFPDTLNGDPNVERGSLGDASIHLFYPLDDAAFVSFLGELRAVKRENGGNPALGVHPVLAREGLGGKTAAKLRALLLETCTSARLSKMTFMATGRSGNNWFWHALVRGADGTWKQDEGELAHGAFLQDGRNGTLDGAPIDWPGFPNELAKTARVLALSDAEFFGAAEKLQRVENPSLLAVGEVRCDACHAGYATLRNAAKARGLADLPATPAAFVPPKGQNIAHGEPLPAVRNMHAFSWFVDVPTVSQRTINESAVVADFIGSAAFTASLTPELQAIWKRAR